MVLECQQYFDYYVVIIILLNFVEMYGDYVNWLVKGGIGIVKEICIGLVQVEGDFKILIECFVNGIFIDDFWVLINVIYEDVDWDFEFKGWFRFLNVYICCCFQE